MKPMRSPTTARIKVLVVDDSALVRKTITETLSLDPDIEVVGVANDPLIAMEKVARLHPDVMTLDMEMPRMDGLTYLRQLQAERAPVAVVVVSSLTQQGSSMALEAMDAGACEVLAKPDGNTSIGALAAKLTFHVKAAHAAKQRFRQHANAVPPPSPGKAQHHGAQCTAGDRRLVVVGASTGGVEALRTVLPALPDGLPPILVVQHIPAFFSKAVAERLHDLTPYDVREAIDDEPILPGQCLMAPGNYHLMVVASRGGYRTRLTQSPPVHHCRPAVDLLFRSAANVAGRHTLAVLLTGMGSDGALGMQAIHQTGGITLAEHEDSCIIYGMPRAAVQLGVVHKSVTLDRMPQAMLDALAQLPA
ncbi:MAG: chemotaxis response regulator protein-glutamate methylesterase [Limnohabitans sp.]|jgi:two-component system, chemotaxis family, protein-glutamate methylesterase/glutaminase